MGRSQPGDAAHTPGKIRAAAGAWLAYPRAAVKGETIGAIAEGLMLLAGHDSDGEDHEGPVAALALAHMMLDIRSIRGTIDAYFEAISKVKPRK